MTTTDTPRPTVGEVLRILASGFGVDDAANHLAITPAAVSELLAQAVRELTPTWSVTLS